MGHGHLRGAYVILQNGELFLLNATITPHSGVAQGLPENYEPTQNRKLLAKQKEIDQFAEARKQGLQIIPIKLLNKGRFIKVVVAIGRGRKKYDKREAIKKRDFDRSIKQVIV
jgi:SsrA-binding protein